MKATTYFIQNSPFQRNKTLTDLVILAIKVKKITTTSGNNRICNLI